MKKHIALIILSFLVILPIALEALVICGALNTSPNSLFIDVCFSNTRQEENFVEFLDVGQGDSTLIKSENSVALIDFGLEDDGVRIQKCLLRMGIRKIDLAVITHHHRDHMGGFLKVVEKIKVEKLVINNTTAEDGEPELYSEIITVAKLQNIKIILPSVGQIFKIGSAFLSIISCDNSADKENNRSVISMLSICGKSFLFTGDCDGVTEFFVSQSHNIKCDVLKLGHHGSESSSDIRFLELAEPEFAIASCGYDNIYNHPSPKALSRLDEMNIEIYRTDLDKDIRFTFENGQNNFSVSIERGTV